MMLRNEEGTERKERERLKKRIRRGWKYTGGKGWEGTKRKRRKEKKEENAEG